MFDDEMADEIAAVLECWDWKARDGMEGVEVVLDRVLATSHIPLDDLAAALETVVDGGNHNLDTNDICLLRRAFRRYDLKFNPKIS